MTNFIVPGKRGRTKRHKQVPPYVIWLLIVVVLLGFTSNQDYSPSKLMTEVAFSSSNFKLAKQQSRSNSQNKNRHTPPSTDSLTKDPSSLPFDKDYLPRKPKEKWRNRHLTGVRMGTHKLKKVPKLIFSEMEQQEEAAKNETSTTVNTKSNIYESTTVHYHAIVVPYRNREYHLQEFQKRLYPYIEKHYRQEGKHVSSEFSLWIVEQDDEEPFNRGWLGNVGIAEILRHTPEVECFTFHDVDFVPEDVDENPAVKGPVYYDKCSVPTQTGSELFRTGLNWTVGHQEYAGGVVTMHLQHWQAINGFSNDYVSWGGEDDDLYLRLRDKGLLSENRQRKFLMRRPPLGFGRFRTMSDDKEHHVQDADKGKNANYQVSLQILQQVRDGTARVQRSDYDGLSDLQYKVSSHKVRRSSSPSFGFEMAHHLKVKQQLLELISIPGTGAGWIETAASRLGIPWGRCHFEQDDDDEEDYDYFRDNKRKENQSRDKEEEERKSKCLATPDFANLGLTTKHKGNGAADLWHVPPHLWNINMFEGKHTFVVVRNPYELVIARYLEFNSTSQDDDPSFAKEEEQKLNEFVEFKLCTIGDSVSNKAETMWHFSQYDHVFFNGTQRANHVLKYENLDSELPLLMQQYDLPLDLRKFENKPTTEDDGREGARSLPIHSLTNRSLALIQIYYARDFEEFGYSQLLQDIGDYGPMEPNKLCRPTGA